MTKFIIVFFSGFISSNVLAAEYQISIFDNSTSRVISKNVSKKLLPGIINQYKIGLSSEGLKPDYYVIEHGPKNSFYMSAIRECSYKEIKRPSSSVQKQQIFIEGIDSELKIPEVIIQLGQCVHSSSETPVDVFINE